MVQRSVQGVVKGEDNYVLKYKTKLKKLPSLMGGGPITYMSSSREV